MIMVDIGTLVNDFNENKKIDKGVKRMLVGGI